MIKCYGTPVTALTSLSCTFTLKGKVTVPTTNICFFKLILI